MCMCLHEIMCTQKQEEVRSTGTGDRDECEMPDVDARNQTQVLHKSSMCS